MSYAPQADGGREETRFEAIGENGIVLRWKLYESRAGGRQFAATRSVVQFVPFGGEQVNLIEYRQDNYAANPYLPQPQAVGRFVVYRHPRDGDFVIFASATLASQRVDPFGP